MRHEFEDHNGVAVEVDCSELVGAIRLPNKASETPRTRLVLDAADLGGGVVVRCTWGEVLSLATHAGVEHFQDFTVAFAEECSDAAAVRTTGAGGPVVRRGPDGERIVVRGSVEEAGGEGSESGSGSESPPAGDGGSGGGQDPADPAASSGAAGDGGGGEGAAASGEGPPDGSAVDAPTTGAGDAGAEADAGGGADAESSGSKPATSETSPGAGDAPG